MHIGGLQKCSLIDYPGKLSAILFTTGCNFRCHYCHNPELVLPRQYAPEIPLEEVYAFLKKRVGQLDAVTITGGEPTFHKELPEMIKKIKKMGFLIKLDTNGTALDMLQYLLREGLLDYVAMDVKAPLQDYKKIVGWAVSPDTLQASIDLLIHTGIPHEFRTTLVKELTSKEDIRQIAQTIQGADAYYLQRFIPSKLNNPAFQTAFSYSHDELTLLANELTQYVKGCHVR